MTIGNAINRADIWRTLDGQNIAAFVNQRFNSSSDIVIVSFGKVYVAVAAVDAN